MRTNVHARPARPLATIAFILLVLACAGDGTAPEPSPLAGLNAGVGAADSAGNPPPPNPTPGTTPGYVPGTVLGPSAARRRQ